MSNSKSNAWETAVLALLFTNSNFANVGDATGLRGSSTAGSLYVSLHTSSPGEAGSQTTNEATYTGYARVAVVRSGSGWTVASGAVSNAAAVTFPACSAGSPQTITHFGVGTDPTGAGTLLYFDALTASVSVGVGVTPQFAIGALAGTEE